MFCAGYRFRVKPGCEDQLRDAWCELTELIHEHCGSLGSRLHVSSAGEYIAYAQWPRREMWENPAALPKAAIPVRERMLTACESIDTLYELAVTDDLLKPQTTC